VTKLSAIVPATDSPATLELAVEAIRNAADPPDELIVVRDCELRGAAAARNLGVRQATGDVLVFVDADVLVAPDAFTRIRAAFDSEPRLTALFGSYDDDPPRQGLVSDFRNLLHHHVHQSDPGEASTFWTGLGALRRMAFEEAAGFDDARYSGAEIEDIELGTRLADMGARVVLDPQLQGKHLKRTTLWRMLRTDVVLRGAPWTALMLERRSAPTSLNLSWGNRLSALASLVGAAGLVLRRPRAVLGALAALVAINHRFYALLWRRNGVRGAASGVVLHALHHLAGIVALPVGVVRFARGRPSAQLAPLPDPSAVDAVQPEASVNGNARSRDVGGVV
jgi:cellulose synthase/poly-beta-1,6-N-acetylglucosamine synthase-like glycosyltransferase